MPKEIVEVTGENAFMKENIWSTKGNNIYIGNNIQAWNQDSITNHMKISKYLLPRFEPYLILWIWFSINCSEFFLPLNSAIF